MVQTAVTYKPFNVQLGGVESGNTWPAPVPFGGGSLIDDSDASGVEIGTHYDTTAGSDAPDLLYADFQVPADLSPTWAHIAIRAKTATGYTSSSGLNDWRGIYRTDDPDGWQLYYQSWPPDLANGTAASPAWFREFYAGYPILDGAPGDDTNWANLPRDWPNMLDALTTTGLRVGYFVYTNSPTRVPVMDLYEIRLVVTVDGAPAPARPIRGPRVHPLKAARWTPRRGPSAAAATRRFPASDR